MIDTATMARRLAGRAIVVAVLILGVAAGAREAGAQSISVNGSPPLMSISTATAGLAPNAVFDNSTTYTVGAGGGGSQVTIMAHLATPMPAGVTLTVSLAAPGGGATSLGPVVLSTAPQSVVTGVHGGSVKTQSISYQLSATAAAGVVPVQSRSVVFTLVVTP